MFLAQFPPPNYPKGPSHAIEDAIAHFSIQHAIFDQNIENWGHIPDEWMVDYVERFELNIIEEFPYRLSETCKCRLFWQGVPFYIRVYVDYDLHDYYNLKIKVIQAERKYLR